MVDFIHFTCNVCLVTSDSTGTVSGTVSAQNNVGPVRSRNIFCSGGGTCNSPYRKLVCGPWGKVGSSKERVRTADKHRSVPNTCSLHPTGRATDRPSTLPLMSNDPGIPRTGHRYHAHGHPRSYTPPLPSTSAFTGKMLGGQSKIKQ